jgi:hypothetical protein
MDSKRRPSAAPGPRVPDRRNAGAGVSTEYHFDDGIRAGGKGRCAVPLPSNGASSDAAIPAARRSGGRDGFAAAVGGASESESGAGIQTGRPSGPSQTCHLLGIAAGISAGIGRRRAASSARNPRRGKNFEIGEGNGRTDGALVSNFRFATARRARRTWTGRRKARGIPSPLGCWRAPWELWRRRKQVSVHRAPHIHACTHVLVHTNQTQTPASRSFVYCTRRLG